jgi:Fe-S oxidoreductase
MASLEEKDSTRARANMLRQILSSDEKQPFSNPELNDILDLCLSCKGCQTECPSGVDISKLKAETLQQKYLAQGIPVRTQLIGHFPKTQQWASYIAPIYNFLIEFPITNIFIKAVMGFAQQRSLPAVHFTTLESWFNRYQQRIPQEKFKHGFVYLFADEFTNYNDVDLGKKTIKLLNELGFGVKIPTGLSSGRSYLSKGMLIEAKQIAINNLEILQNIITDKHPLIGIEPSAILTFRDEIPDLVGANHRATALAIKPHCLLIDEFLALKIEEKIITKEIFTGLPQKILLHGHCHQKAIAGLVSTRKALSFPENFEVELLPTGCCGMAGSFGYEKKHYSMSQKIANLVLFPRVLQAKDTVTVASNGTSCRHQLKDGIQKQGFHTAEILYNALSNKTIK